MWWFCLRSANAYRCFLCSFMIIFHNWKCFLLIDSLYFISPLLGSQQSQEQPSRRGGSSSDMHNESGVSSYHILIKMRAAFSNLSIVVIPNASWGVEFHMLILCFAFLLTVMQNSSCKVLAEIDTLQYRSVSITSRYSVLLSQPEPNAARPVTSQNHSPFSFI